MNRLYTMQLFSRQSSWWILQQLGRLCCVRNLPMICVVVSLMGSGVWAQSESDRSAQLSALVVPHTYVQKRASSYDRSGGNDDFVKIAPAETITLLDDSGPAIITHL